MSDPLAKVHQKEDHYALQGLAKDVAALREAASDMRDAQSYSVTHDSGPRELVPDFSGLEDGLLSLEGEVLQVGEQLDDVRMGVDLICENTSSVPKMSMDVEGIHKLGKWGLGVAVVYGVIDVFQKLAMQETLSGILGVNTVTAGATTATSRITGEILDTSQANLKVQRNLLGIAQQQTGLLDSMDRTLLAALMQGSVQTALQGQMAGHLESIDFTQRLALMQGGVQTDLQEQMVERLNIIDRGLEERGEAMLVLAGESLVQLQDVNSGLAQISSDLRDVRTTVRRGLESIEFKVHQSGLERAKEAARGHHLLERLDANSERRHEEMMEALRAPFEIRANEKYHHALKNFKIGKFSSALRDLKQALTECSTHVPSIMLMGRIAEDLAQWPQAKDFYDHALKLLSSDRDAAGALEALARLALIEFKVGNYEQAAVLIKEFVDVDLDDELDFEGYLSLADLAFSVQSYNQASELYCQYISECAEEGYTYADAAFENLLQCDIELHGFSGNRARFLDEGSLNTVYPLLNRRHQLRIQRMRFEFDRLLTVQASAGLWNRQFFTELDEVKFAWPQYIPNESGSEDLFEKAIEPHLRKKDFVMVDSELTENTDFSELIAQLYSLSMELADFYNKFDKKKRFSVSAVYESYTLVGAMFDELVEQVNSVLGSENQTHAYKYVQSTCWRLVNEIRRYLSSQGVEECDVERNWSLKTEEGVVLKPACLPYSERLKSEWTFPVEEEEYREWEYDDWENPVKNEPWYD